MFRSIPSQPIRLIASGLVLTASASVLCAQPPASTQQRAERAGPSSPAGPRELRERVEIRPDIQYAATDDPAQRLDLFLPKQRAGSKPLPIIVFIHGGAWKNGDKRSGFRHLAPLVATGKYAGATIEYRLTGQAIWPAQIHDCKAAIRWLRGNAKQHGLDPNRLVAWGTSAGGHLVAMLGTTGGVEELDGDLGDHDDQSSRVTAVINFFGPSDLATMNEGGSTMDHYAKDSPETNLIGETVQAAREKWDAASPLSYVSADDAPMLIMHGDKDPLVPHRQSVIVRDALVQAGVEATLVTVKDAGHGFGGPDITDRVEQFLGKHLLGESVDVLDTAIQSPVRRENATGD